MTRCALGALAAAAALAGSCTTTDDRYRVDAFAELVPLRATGPQITGRLDVLGAAQRHEGVDFARVLAAHQVHLPTGTAPWIRLWNAASCTAQDGSQVLYQDLGLIRTVDDDVHFFDRGVVIAGRTVDLDVDTATARVTLDPMFDSPLSGRLFDLIAVAQSPDDGGQTTIETSTGRTVPAGGEWLACGSFVRAP